MKNCRKAIVALLISIVASTAICAPLALAEDVPAVDVPASALVISGGELKGVSKEWIDRQGPSPSIRVAVPAGVTRVGNNAFSEYNYNKDCANSRKYTLVSLDMSSAVDLSFLGSQCFMGSKSLSGKVDLSSTKVSEIGTSAFLDCASLQEVVIPDSVKSIGSQAFRGCSGLASLRTSGSAEAFSLPQALESVGETAFYASFASETRVLLPASVEKVGNRAFDSDKIAQVVVGRDVGTGLGYSGYSKQSFGYSKNTVAVFPSYDSYAAFSAIPGSLYATLSFPTEARFLKEGLTVYVQAKLAGASFRYVKEDSGSSLSFWRFDRSYEFPDSDGSASTGYRTAWLLENVIPATEDSKVPVGNAGSVSLFASQALQDPTVKPAVDGSPSLPQASDKDFSVEVVVDPLDPDAAHSAGVLVDHPLLMGNHGTADDHVFFKYAWWDEKDGRADGPRSQSEPDLFSSHQDHRVITGNPSIPISGVSDARTGNDQYMVEIYGYHVVDGTEKLFYKSHPNFIAFGGPTDPEATTDTCYTLQVATRLADKAAYKVEHYRQSLDGSYPSTPDEVENLAAATGEEVSAKARPYEGFSVDASAPGSVSSGPVAADGSLVLKLYYSRNVHQVSWSTDGDPLQGAYTSGPTMFGAPITAPGEPTKAGFSFAGWSPAPAASMPDSDVSYAATWTPAAKPSPTDQGAAEGGRLGRNAPIDLKMAKTGDQGFAFAAVAFLVAAFSSVFVASLRKRVK